MRSGQTPDPLVAWASYIFSVSIIVVVTIIIVLQASDDAVEPILGGVGGCIAGYRVGGPLTCAVGTAGGAYATMTLTQSATNVQLHLDGSIEQRQAGLSTHLMLTHAPDGEPVRHKLQRYFGCNTMSDPPYECGDAGDIPGAVRDAVDDTIPGDTGYYVRFQYAGESFTAPEDRPTLSGETALHTTVVPMPGGRRINVKVEMEGIPGGARWGQ